MEQDSAEQNATSRLVRFSAWVRPWSHTVFVPLGCVLVAGLIIWWFAVSARADTSADSIGVVLLTFRQLHENLPLTLPILSACLSIMLNVREILRPHGWLKLPLPLSLGLVSFSIWYVVAAQSTSDEFIRIGSDKVLDRQFAVVLLVIAFIWAGFAAIGRVLGESQEEDERGWRWYGGQALILVVSLIALSIPFFLFESKTTVEARLKRSLDESLFSVSVPYRDASHDQHDGRVTDPINQCEVVSVIAKTSDEAIAEAKKRFLASERAQQYYNKTRQVEIFASWIVAERQSNAVR